MKRYLSALVVVPAVCNYWNGPLKNRNYLNILFLLQPMQYYRPGQLHSMLRSGWLLKRIVPGWNEVPDAGQKGLAAARSIALLSYRHYNGYDITQPRDKAFVPLSNEVIYAADNYQRYQGLKLVNRFNAICYYRLTQSMDSHDVGRNRGGVEKALQQITAKTLVIGIKSDVLYPITEQEFLQETYPRCAIAEHRQRFWS